MGVGCLSKKVGAEYACEVLIVVELVIGVKVPVTLGVMVETELLLGRKADGAGVGQVLLPGQEQ